MKNIVNRFTKLINKRRITHLPYIGDRGIAGTVPFTRITKDANQMLRRFGEFLVYDQKFQISRRTRDDIAPSGDKENDQLKKWEASRRRGLKRLARLEKKLKENTQKGGKSPSKKLAKEHEKLERQIAAKKKDNDGLAKKIIEKGGVLDVTPEEEKPGGGSSTTRIQTRAAGAERPAAQDRNVRTAALPAGSSGEGSNAEQDVSNYILVNYNYYNFRRFLPRKRNVVSYHKSVVLDLTGGNRTHVQIRWREHVLGQLVDKAKDLGLTQTSQWRRSLGQDEQWFSLDRFLDQYLSYSAFLVVLYVKLKTALFMLDKYSFKDRSMNGVALYYVEKVIGPKPSEARDRVRKLEKQLTALHLPDGMVKLLIELSSPFFDCEYEDVLQSNMMYEILPVFKTVEVRIKGRSFTINRTDITQVTLGRLADFRKIVRNGGDGSNFLIYTTDAFLQKTKTRNFTWLQEGLSKIGIPTLNIELLARVEEYPISRPISSRSLLKNSSNMIDVFNVANTFSLPDPRVDGPLGKCLVWQDKRDIKWTKEEGVKVSPIAIMFACHKQFKITKSRMTNLYQPGLVRPIDTKHDVDFSIHKRESGEYFIGPPSVRLMGRQRGIPHITLDYVSEWLRKQGSALALNATDDLEISCFLDEDLFNDNIEKIMCAIWNWEILKSRLHGKVEFVSITHLCTFDGLRVKK